MTRRITITIRDTTSGDVHRLDGETECWPDDYTNDTGAIAVRPGQAPFTLKHCTVGDIVYVLSNDPTDGDDPRERLAWRSEILLG